MRRLALLVLIGGCGRWSFDPVPVDADADAGAVTPFVRCLEDDFADGELADWIPVSQTWVIEPTAGPDGSPALHGAGFGTGHQYITHPALSGITHARITLDYMTANEQVGDFVVDVVTVGWTQQTDPHYAVELFPPGSDSTPDVILWETPLAVGTLAMHAPTAVADSWHRVEIAFAADHAIDVSLDGVPHLASGADSRIDGPFAIMIHLFNDGYVDNVVVDCAR